MVINLCTHTAMDSADSYGIIAIELARQLSALGVRVNLFALGGLDHPNCPPDIAKMAKRRSRKAAEGSIYMGWPTNVAKFPAHVRQGKSLIITMHESSSIPAAWLPILNTMDAVVTPSVFCSATFRRCGVTAALHVAPLGISAVYKPYRRPVDRPLTFLAFLDRGLRKGGLVAQQAFSLAFGDDPSYQLVLKRRTSKVNIDFENPNIRVIQHDMSEAELYDLYCSCDVLINPNQGEGFGLIPREFAATGGVALATDWGGTADDLAAWGWPLPYKLVPADWKIKAFAGQDMGEWAQPDIEGVAQRLIDIAAHRNDYQAAAMEKAHVSRSMYSWRCFAERVLTVWKGIVHA